MKTLFNHLIALFFIVVLNVPMMAQQDTNSLTGWFKWAHGPLDKSGVESGILIQQTPIFIWPGIYDGVNVHDSLALNLSKWGWLYGQFIAASVSASYLPDPSIYVQPSMMPHRYGQPVQLMYMATQYDMIREGALDENLVYIDNDRWYDVPGRSESPYIQDTCYALAPLQHDVWGMDLTLVLSDSLLLNNLGWSIDSFEIDAGDGLGWRMAWPDSIINISYDFEGRKEVRIRVRNGINTYLAQTYLLIKEYELGGRSGEGLPYDSKNPEKISLDGVALSLYSSCSDKKIRRPLIVVEGYPNFSMADEALFDAESGLLSQENLNEWLNDREYDIIWVDWADNASSVPTQANRLINVIEWVNDRKHADGSNEPNVMIGASFGGLVGKFAMLHMHNILGLDSEVETFFTYDSPLKGANVPVGMQAFLRDLEKQIEGFGGSIAPLKQALVLMDGPAPKQMLLKRVELNWNGTEFQFELSDGLFLALQNQIEAMESKRSMDKICRFITLSNGADAGFAQSYLEPKQKILDFFLDLDEIPGVKVLGNKVPEWCYDVRIEAQAYSADNINTKIYSRRIWSINYCLGNQIKEQGSLSWNIDSPLGLDNAPGGWSNLGLDMLKDGVESMKPDIPHAKELTFSLLPAYSFIPTVSSLDMPLGTDRYTNAPEGGPSVLRWSASTEATPLSWDPNLSDKNQKHVRMDGRIASLLFSELGLGKVQALQSPLAPGQIYNFGKTSPNQATPISTPRTINEDITLSSGAELWINRLNKIGYINSANPENAAPQSFHVSVPGVSCTGDEEEVVVDVNDGGRIVIGEVEGATINTGKLTFLQMSSLIVKNGGEILLTRSVHNNLILQGGNMEIKSGGFVRAEHGSRIIVREGSTLTIRSGGILRIAHHSSLLVEAGGKLVLEPGAIIQLWDGPKLQGEGTIHIQKDGELEWQGDIQFLGNGYFQFDAGHIFTLLADFNLTGYAKDCRFIRLNPKAHLNIDGYNMTLTDGLIESIDGGSIRNLNGNVALEEITFSGPGNIALKDPISSIIANSTILNASLEIEGFQGNREDNLIKNCVFEYSGFSGKSSKWMTLIDNTFLNGGPSMYCEEVDYVYCSGIYMDGESTPNNNAVILHNTPIFRFHHSNIRDYETGIYVLRTNENERTNLFLYGSTINDCGVGIYDPDLDLDKELPGYENGLVLMDCSRLAENGEGILGGDLLLSIDAQIHSGSHIGGEVYPNYFANYPIINTPYTNNIFEICYNNRQPDEILARRNEWANGVPNPSFDFRIKRISTNNPSNPQCSNNSNVSPDVPVIFQPIHFSDVALYCPEPPRISPHNPCFGCLVDDVDPTDECIVGVTQMVSVHDSYRYGIYNFYHENLEEATAWFQPIAAISDDQRSNLSAKCQHYIDVARVMTNALQEVVQDSVPPIIPIWSNPFDNKEEGLLTHSLEASYLQVYPNPANDQLTIQLSESSDAVVYVVNMMGTLHRTFPSGDLQTIPTGDWPAGLYEIQLRDATGRIVHATRISIVH